MFMWFYCWIYDAGEPPKIVGIVVGQTMLLLFISEYTPGGPSKTCCATIFPMESYNVPAESKRQFDVPAGDGEPATLFGQFMICPSIS